MAIDTERKRKSVAGVGRKWHPGVVVSDGSFDQGDRQTIGRSYHGILAGAPVVGVVVRRVQQPYVMKMIRGLRFAEVTLD